MPDTSPSTGARKLVIWPPKTDLTRVKAAVLGLNLGYPVQPFWFDPGNNDGTRVLVLEDGFDYSTITDRIYPKTDAVLPDAILWCLGEKELERGPSYAEDVMASYGLKLIDIEPWGATGDEPREGEPW